jgi:hypothetical protein
MIFCKSFENKVKMSPSPPLESYKIPLKSSLSSSCKSGRGDFCSCRNCYSKANNNNNIIDAKYERREDDNPMMGGGGGVGRRRNDKDNDFRKNTTSPFDDFESGLMRQHSERYRKSTERPHHQQFVEDRFERSHHRRQIDDHNHHHHQHQKSKKMIENVRSNGNKFSDRNPYREPDNLFYHESVENMLKSPLLNNYTNRKQYHGNSVSAAVDSGVNDEQYRVRRKQQQQQSHHHEAVTTRKSTHSAPESSLRKSSPKERFLSAKEKFQAIAEQRNRYDMPKEHHRQQVAVEKCPSDVCSDCSVDDNSCEDSDCSKRNELSFYRQSHLTKSLGNLNRGGYRHSVALPDMSYNKYCNRVGLAAIDY